MLKLYQADWSPFPTRVRLVLYAKNIPFEPIYPPGFDRPREERDEYRRINPMGRIPALLLEDGRILPESEVICEYLEDIYPEPRLRPTDPFDRAQMRLISRLCDIYVVMAMVPLFDASGQRRKDWNIERIDRALSEVKKSLEYVEAYIGSHGYAVGTSLTQADGAVIPLLVLAFEWAPVLFDRTSTEGDLPKLSAYWKAIAHDPIASRLIHETREAITALQKPREKS
ncbi:MAG TPA: glutathione S-transferase family protein [Rhizomicrobium sp.]|jgi:glutathione S-transferase|nr:glutathione S-transferase family protein [Rhizomicrobium sp.]